MIAGIKRYFKRIFILLSHLTDNWNIARKISYGYTVAGSITFIGTISGLLIAYRYETLAQQQLNLSEQKQSLLKDLENKITRVRLHPQRLVTVWENSIWLEFEKNRFVDEMSQVNQQLSKLEVFIKNYTNDSSINNSNLLYLLNNYRKNTKVYIQVVQNFWQQIDQHESLTKVGEEKLIKFFQKEVNVSIEFEKLSDELILIIGYAEIQKQKAISSFENAQKLRIKIIVGSMLLTAAIAIMLALYTSSLIARPLEIVTNVARKITQESNFQLRANIRSKDEVGTLAASLNQLVEWVGDYTQELQLARQSLEQRVEERTQELQLARQNLEHRVEERTQELKKTLQDLKETQGQLIQSEKMSSLGQMVAGIAHEINNPVNFIYGNIQCISEYTQDLFSLVSLYQEQYSDSICVIEERIQEIDLNFINQDLPLVLSSMKVGAERIREIVLCLRNFSRLDEAEIKEVDIHQGIDNTLLILNHRFQPEIEVIKNYGNLPLVECYPAQLNQVFLNILNNAIDAILDEKNDKYKNKQIIIHTLKIDDTYIKIGIKDSGYGISVDIQNKLFDPFFTTKAVGKGTGLGLSLCYQIIDKHKGKIEVISELEKGAEFVIILPIKTQYHFSVPTS
ncbi:HAMP domain-containing protein [Nostoc punctiforme FACHB-252]|uniref:histidine kinase n=1 Tax=Nostoc punctiforme FACHB-252 TaxID=1357509 RepID=A0ABR8H3X2_NOSPU|nr:ATP-binding protein [Nostoc punctiforme]MBD2609748.1 HAMP domain-containing protein [Nostoc punctiforme FACHB-252]